MRPDIRGLEKSQIETQRKFFGSNIIEHEGKKIWWENLKNILSEPLFLILVFAAILYFVLGESNEGFIMILAIIFVSGISLYQENRSNKAVESLKKIGSPKAKVRRDGNEVEIYTEEIVVGDILFLEDGKIVPADASIIECYDFSINESLLTGESVPVFKSGKLNENEIKSGTLVVSGACLAQVKQVGKQTEMGKIGKSLSNIDHQKTPLQLQLNSFTKSMVFYGAAAFILVWGLNYLISQDFIQSLLKGLTLAMSVLPEEIPVAFSTFMALGAYHLYKKNVIAKSPYTVETLGAATVICADKTGTLTENKMQLAAIYEMVPDVLSDCRTDKVTLNPVLEYAMWASEVSPFDPMEISIHQAYSKAANLDLRVDFSIYKEYPLSGNPPVMTHVFKNSKDEFIIAIKGSVEGVVRQCTLTYEQKEKIDYHTNDLASKGFRVLGVGKALNNKPPFSDFQSEIEFEFLGLIAFYDPPKKNINSVINDFYKAGISVKMVTGDFAPTALAIAKQVGMRNAAKALTGSEIIIMEPEELKNAVREVNIFARMFPEAKLKLIEALKLNQEIVAMTGDGVNDALALKSAHIGIAMGQSGSDVAKDAAALVLMDDDLKWMVDAVALGRRIYENLKKAIMYIISIHIPIILIVALPLIFSWAYTDIFSPVHVVFLELIMGPTCSIIFENEPIEANSMQRPPRKATTNLFASKELGISIIQGLIITLTCLGIGYYFMQQGSTESTVRTVIYTTLILSNIFLTLVNRSMFYPVWVTIKYRNQLIPMIIVISLIVLVLSIYVPSIQGIFRFNALTAKEFFICFVLAIIGVMWVEIYKLYLRNIAASANQNTLSYL